MSRQARGGAMWSFLSLAIFWSILVSTTQTYHGHDVDGHRHVTRGHQSIDADIAGDYCRKRIGGCCNGRIDECSTPILGTLCYCDSFCNRTEPDCCPDYFSYCEGLEESIAPPPENIEGCFERGVYYPLGATVKLNCNLCKCEVSPRSSGGGSWELLCERDTCLVDPTLIETINDLLGDLPWNAKNYTQFWGHKLSEAIIYKLGTIEPHRSVKGMLPVKLVYDEKTIPRTFDSRDKWPGWISQPKDQGWCGSDWAFTTATVLGDRLAIHSKGEEVEDLSEEHLLCGGSCQGGRFDKGWALTRRFGIVDEQCYPYESSNGTLSSVNKKCRVPRKVKSLAHLPNNCDMGNKLTGRKELFRSSPAYRVSSHESDIQHEILTNGPVHAVMLVHSDFFSYSDGIYKRSGLSPAGSRTGWHSVRIIGWGEEFTLGQFTKYWLVSNSWGSSWGEKGHFRILRGENECDIESFVVSAWARPSRELLFKHHKNHHQNQLSNGI